jgi:hypothetical protein
MSVHKQPDRDMRVLQVKQLRTKMFAGVIGCLGMSLGDGSATFSMTKVSP